MYVSMYLCIYLFANIKQQKFTVIFNTRKTSNSKNKISDKNPSLEKSLDRRWQG